MFPRILLTGGCGFIGSNFVRFVLEQRPRYHLTNLDALSYCGNPENLADLEQHDRYQFVHGDIRDLDLTTDLIRDSDAVIHMAAESHVDRSIMDARPFVESNVLGTQVILDALRRVDTTHKRKFVHVSTDEVYGELPLDQPELKFTEQWPLRPNSPYAASKAGSDLIVHAYHQTYGIQSCITRCSNNFGPYQFPEKVIPLFVTNLIEGKKVPLYGDGRNVRDWLHVEDHCDALLNVLERGRAGEVYNIGGNNEHSNLDLTKLILRFMETDEQMIERVQDRPGHDRRYAIDAGKIQRELGWHPTRSAWPGALERTVQWYLDHPNWWRRVKRGQYRQYDKQHCSD